MTNWKQKLAAYLHDPPSGCFDLGGHMVNAATLMRATDFTEANVRACDRAAIHQLPTVPSL